MPRIDLTGLTVTFCSTASRKPATQGRRHRILRFAIKSADSPTKGGKLPRSERIAGRDRLKQETRHATGKAGPPTRKCSRA